MPSDNTLNLPKIIFGTSALGNLYNELPENTKTKIVSECFSKGGKQVVFDSAGKYGAGLALETLGNILEKLNIPEDEVLISNKLGWLRTPLRGKEPTFEPGVWKGLKNDAVQRISYEGILECFEQGNQLLGKYKPQMVSVHDPDEYLALANSEEEYQKLFNDILEAYRALAELKNRGLVKAIGIGAKNWKIIYELHKCIELDWIMFANSMTIMKHPKELLEFMQELQTKGVTIINSAVFQAGFLVGGEFFDYSKIKPDSTENIKRFEWRDKFNAVCKLYNVDPMVACVNFALRAPGVHALSLNTSKFENVGKNIKAINTEVPKEFYTAMKAEALIQDHCTFV